MVFYRQAAFRCGAKAAGNPSITDPEVSLRWRPYLLYPNLPPEGVDRGELLRRRYGPRGDKGRVPATILAEAEAEGIGLRYDLIQRTPNTLPAHRLVEWVYLHQGWRSQHELVETLFLAYFCQGLMWVTPAVLRELAQPYGLNSEQLDGVLNGSGEVGTHLNAQTHRQLERAKDLGVSGVPGYVMGGSYHCLGPRALKPCKRLFSGRKLSSLLTDWPSLIAPEC